MGLFRKQIEFIESLPGEIFRILKETIEENDFFLTNAITEKQLFEEGIDGKGNRLPGYVRTTIRIKISKGQPADRTTLRDTGDYHASFTIDAYDDRFEVKTNVDYDKYIVGRYGEDIMRVTIQNMREFLETYYKPNLIRYVNNKIAG